MTRSPWASTCCISAVDTAVPDDVPPVRAVRSGLSAVPPTALRAPGKTQATDLLVIAFEGARVLVVVAGRDDLLTRDARHQVRAVLDALPEGLQLDVRHDHAVARNLDDV